MPQAKGPYYTIIRPIILYKDDTIVIFRINKLKNIRREVNNIIKVKIINVLFLFINL